MAEITKEILKDTIKILKEDLKASLAVNERLSVENEIGVKALKYYASCDVVGVEVDNGPQARNALYEMGKALKEIQEGK